RSQELEGAPPLGRERERAVPGRGPAEPTHVLAEGERDRSRAARERVETMRGARSSVPRGLSLARSGALLAATPGAAEPPPDHLAREAERVEELGDAPREPRREHGLLPLGGRE